MEINGIAHTFVTVGDFDRSRAFYSRLLPFLGMKNVMDIPGTYYCVGGRTGFAIREAPEENRGGGNRVDALAHPGWENDPYRRLWLRDGRRDLDDER